MARSFQDHFKARLTFWGLVTVVMTALRLKDQLDEDAGLEEAGSNRIVLEGEERPLNVDPEAGLVPLDTELQLPMRNKRKRSRHCCACCSPTCGLFWKAVGIVLLLTIAFQSIRLLIWAITPTPTGLEGMPEFKKSLACKHAPYIYNNATFDYPVQLSAEGKHSLRIRGGAVGSLVLMQGEEDATEVEYKVTIRSDEKDVLERVRLTNPSYFDIQTPLAASHCMEFELTATLPPGLKDLFISTDSITHIKFDEGARVRLNSLIVDMTWDDQKNLFLPHDGIVGLTTSWHMRGGYLKGSTLVGETFKIDNRWGSAVTDIKAGPDPTVSGNVTITTVTGNGRMNFAYLDPSDNHRTMHNSHTSAHREELYLDYTKARFAGLIDLTKLGSFRSSGLRGGERFTNIYWAGEDSGEDRVLVKSDGWARLSF